MANRKSLVVITNIYLSRCLNSRVVGLSTPGERVEFSIDLLMWIGVGIYEPNKGFVFHN